MKTLYKHENLAFISSSCINVYPCGRRRAVSITNGVVTGSIPFDPESKLTTERNLRHLTAINGYNTTYVYEITDNAAVFVIDGYLFKVNIDAFLESTNVNINNFGSKIWDTLNSGSTPDGTKYLCAKIKLNEIPLVDMLGAAEFVRYSTPILESQHSTEGDIDAGLDLNLLENNTQQLEHYTNYAFTGLSFVTVPNTEFTPYSEGDELTKHFIKNAYTGEITLKLLQYTGKGWEVCQEALLPNILHDITENSVRIIGELTADAKSHFKGYVHILNGASIDDNLAVSGNTALKGSLTVNGGLNVNSASPAIFTCTTTFNKEATFNGPITAVQNVTISQDVEIGNALYVTGHAEIDNGLTLTGDLEVAQGGISVTDDINGDIATKANVFADKSIIANSQLATHKELLVNIADGGCATFGTLTVEDGHLTNDATQAAGSISLDPADTTKVLASFNHVDADRVRTKKGDTLQEVAVIETNHVTGDTYKLIIK